MTYVAGDFDTTPSGVEIARDFRDNLIIDRYDPVFADMRASKVKHLRSANSEDAITWNVFRSLRQIAPAFWLNELWRRSFPDSELPSDVRVSVQLWPTVPPPLGLLAEGDEGSSEIDILIESATWVWFIEAKYGSDISLGTTTRPSRDQLLRNIDVGSYYAGVRSFYFSLLTLSPNKSPIGLRKIAEYSDFAVIRSALAKHRPDGLANLRGVGSLTWAELSDILKVVSESQAREDEREFARRAFDWLKKKGIARDGV